MTSTELDQQYYGQVICMDETYALPTKRWIADVFAPYFRGFLEHIGAAGYAPQNDCENFSAEAWVRAARCHAKTHTRTEQGLAFGIFNYHSETLGGHSINTAYTDEGVVFWEPQKQEFLTLTVKEIQYPKVTLF